MKKKSSKAKSSQDDRKVIAILIAKQQISFWRTMALISASFLIILFAGTVGYSLSHPSTQLSKFLRANAPYYLIMILCFILCLSFVIKAYTLRVEHKAEILNAKIDKNNLPEKLQKFQKCFKSAKIVTICWCLSILFLLTIIFMPNESVGDAYGSAVLLLMWMPLCLALLLMTVVWWVTYFRERRKISHPKNVSSIY